MSSSVARSAPSPWPRLLAWATLLAALPLVLLGGTVTTLRAGMSIDGWFVLEPGRGDHFLLAYPLEKWFRDAGTFSEHSHRLAGALVGVLAIAQVIAAATLDRRREVLACAAASLLAVCAQGALGGLRVLENSDDLAFLHGACAQAVFALLAANVVLTSPAWRDLPRTGCKRTQGARRLAWLALALIYAQIVLGAWLRHSGAGLPFALHLAGVLAVLAAVIAAARQWKLAFQAGAESGVDRAPLRRAARNLHVLLGVQLFLGIAATVAVLLLSGGFQGRVSSGEMIFATAHVLCGALLLAQSLAGLLWSYRLTATASELHVCAASLGVAR